MSAENLSLALHQSLFNRAVRIRLVTLSESVERTLVERVSLKLGRQVKSAQEKLQMKIGGPLDNNELNNDAVHKRSIDSSTVPTDAEPVKPQSAPHSKPNNTIETVWFKSKVVSRSHAEIWFKDGQVYLRDVGSSSGTFLNDLRLSPPSKMSRPYPLREGDVVQLGVDYQGRTEDMYKAVEIKVSLEYDDEHAKLQQQIPLRFKAALFLLLVASNPYASQKEQDPKQDTSVDCCICICGIGPFQALFIAPCSHCFHYKCIQHVLKESIMFPCPVCRQVANLEASVSMESIAEGAAFNTSTLRRSISSLGLGEEMQIDQTFSIESSVNRQQFEFEIGARRDMLEDIDISPGTALQTSAPDLASTTDAPKMNVDFP